MGQRLNQPKLPKNYLSQICNALYLKRFIKFSICQCVSPNCYKKKCDFMLIKPISDINMTMPVRAFQQIDIILNFI